MKEDHAGGKEMKRGVICSIVFILLLTVMVACGSENENDLQSTVEAQNTRIAELTNADATAVEETPANQIQTTPTTQTEPAAIPSEEQNVPSPSLLWSITTSSWAIQETQVIVEDSEGQIKALNLEDGASVWISDERGQIIGADPNYVYLQATQQRIDALDMHTGQLVWTALFSNRIEPLRPIIADNYIYVHLESEIAIVNKENGIVSEIAFRSFDSNIGDILMLQSEPGKTIGYSPITGQAVWEIAANVDRAKLCGEIFVFFSEGKVEAIEATTGNLVWSTERPAGSEPNIACPNNYLMQDSIDQYDVYESQLETLWGEQPPISLESQNVYLTGIFDLAPLIAINRASGEVRWIGNISSTRFNEGGNYYIWLSEINGIVIYSHPGFALTQAYNTTHHELLWENTRITLEKVVGVTNNTLIGKVWEQPQSRSSEPLSIIAGLDMATGQEKWRYQFEQSEEEKFLHGTRNIENVWFVGNHLIYSLNVGATLWILNPQTGELQTSVDPGLEEEIQYVLERGELIIVITSDGLAVISP